MEFNYFTYRKIIYLSYYVDTMNHRSSTLSVSAMALNKRISFSIFCISFYTFSNGFSTNCFTSNVKCQTERRIRRHTQPDSSTVYLNGTVYTVDTNDNPDWDTSPEQAIVVEDGKIAFVGSNEKAKSYIIDGLSKVYDLQHSAVLPGFHDVHMHPLESMSLVGGACLLPRNKRPDNAKLTKVLSKCSENRVGTEWVLGTGHAIALMLEYVREGNSPKDLLDTFISDRPAAMLEETFHSAWVNSKALELANISSNTLDRPGGVIMREPNSNEPNGILFENEAIDIFGLALDSTGNQEIQDIDYNGTLYALNILSEFGITSFCDARVFWKIKHDLVWKKVCDEDSLTARAILGLWAYPNMDDDYQIKKLKELYSAENANCELRKSQIKVYMDGIPQTTTAAMLEKYVLNLSLPIISVDNIGMNYFDEKRLEKYLLELQDFGNGAGFDFHIHAIGDRGIREALNAINATKSNATSRPPRHRLTHLEILDEEDIDRFKALNVIADFQVAGDFTLPQAHKWFAEIIGVEKAKFSIPVKSVVDTGAITTFSSDWDVSDLNPFVGIQHATERGDQSVSVKTAIEMYTVNPAFAMRQENKVGMLKAGMDADFIIVDQDILKISNNMIRKTHVKETVFMGKRIYPEESVLQVSSSDRLISNCLIHIACGIGLFFILV